MASPLLVRWPVGRYALVAGGVGYVAAVVGATVAARPAASGASTRTYVLAFPVMHASWGGGFLLTAVTGWRR